MSFGHGLVAGLKGRSIVERAQDGGAQEALAHGSLAGVEGVEEGCPVVLTHEERLNQFEIAHGHRVQFKGPWSALRT